MPTPVFGPVAYRPHHLIVNRVPNLFDSQNDANPKRRQSGNVEQKWIDEVADHADNRSGCHVTNAVKYFCFDGKASDKKWGAVPANYSSPSFKRGLSLQT